MPEPVSLLQHRLNKAAKRMETAARLSGLIDAAHIAATMGDASRESDCLSEAQKLYEELNAYAQ